MSLLSNFIIDVYSISILIVIYIQSSKHADRDYLHNKLFILLIRVTFMMLFFDILGRFDGNPGTFYVVLNQVGNYTLFLFAPLIPSIWLAYVHYQIYQDENRTRKLLYPLLSISAINFIVLNFSLMDGWFYYIDSSNIYHRGPLYLVPASVPFIFIIVTSVLIFKYKSKITEKYYLPLLLFALPPLIATLFQLIFYGVSLVLNGMVLSILIVQLNIQNKNVFTDYLTGVSNRKKLDSYLRDKIESSTCGRTFSAIMMDIDDFKDINDKFGHDIGDKALQIFANLITTSIRSNDFIGRFGGDEFYVILEVSDEEGLLDVVKRIKNNIDKYNDIGEDPYLLECSMGYAVYDYESKMTSEDFQRYIDNLMYENKRLRKNNKK